MIERKRQRQLAALFVAIASATVLPLTITSGGEAVDAGFTGSAPNSAPGDIDWPQP